MSCHLEKGQNPKFSPKFHQSQVPFYLEMAGLQLGSSAVIRSLARLFFYGLVNPYMVVIVRESNHDALVSFRLRNSVRMLYFDQIIMDLFPSTLIWLVGL